MDVIYPFVMQVTALSVLSCVLEYILPQGGIRSSAQKAVSLVMLLSMAEPVAAAIGGL